MTNEEYFEYMDQPLSCQEKQMLLDSGWQFLNEEYIYIPDDYDGAMAYGIRQIRRVLLHLQHRDVYIKHCARCKDILEELRDETKTIKEDVQKVHIRYEPKDRKNHQSAFYSEAKA